MSRHPERSQAPAVRRRTFCAGAFSTSKKNPTGRHRRRARVYSNSPAVEKGTSQPFVTKKKSFFDSQDTPDTPTEEYKKEGWWSYQRPKVGCSNGPDIFYIHSQIQNHLKSNITTVPKLMKELGVMMGLLSDPDVSQTEKLDAKYQEQMLRKRIVDLEGTLELAMYNFQTDSIIEEYRSLCVNKRKSFVVKNRTSEDVQIERRMGELSEEFIRVAKRYIDIEDLIFKPKNLRCESCGSTDFRLDIEDDHIYTCYNCGVEVEMLDNTPSFKDTDRVNMSSKYLYSRRGHFIEAKKRYQGIQKTDPKKIETAVSTIVSAIEEHGLRREQGHENSVTKDNVYMFLSAKDLSQHYDDINLIFSLVSGTKCTVFSPDLDTRLVEDFDLLDDALEEIKGETDINSLNVNFKLLCLLKRHKFPCDRSEFYMLKTKEKEDEHIEKMKEAFDKLGWEWPL